MLGEINIAACDADPRRTEKIRALALARFSRVHRRRAGAVIPLVAKAWRVAVEPGLAAALSAVYLWWAFAAVAALHAR